MGTIFSLAAIAQDVMVVNADALKEHISHRTVPVYPPIAKAARVQGVVVVDVGVGIAGNVESMKVVSGPPMLQQAAIDCLKEWTFHPFEKDGRPLAATGPVSIEFTLDEESAPHGKSKSAEFASSRERCRSEVQERKDPALGCQRLPAGRRTCGVAFSSKDLISRRGDVQAQCPCDSGSSTLSKRKPS